MTINPLALVGYVPPAPPGADGHIHRIMSLLITRVQRTPGRITYVAPNDSGSRDFDLAELVSWAALAAGVRPQLPERTELMLLRARALGVVYDYVEQGRPVRGALLFATDGSMAVSLGSRNRVILWSPVDQAVVVAQDTVRSWYVASRIPGAKGYPR